MQSVCLASLVIETVMNSQRVLIGILAVLHSTVHPWTFRIMVAPLRSTVINQSETLAAASSPSTGSKTPRRAPSIRIHLQLWRYLYLFLPLFLQKDAGVVRFVRDRKSWVRVWSWVDGKWMRKSQPQRFKDLRTWISMTLQLMNVEVHISTLSLWWWYGCWKHLAFIIFIHLYSVTST